VDDDLLPVADALIGSTPTGIRTEVFLRRADKRATKLGAGETVATQSTYALAVRALTTTGIGFASTNEIGWPAAKLALADALSAAQAASGRPFDDFPGPQGQVHLANAHTLGSAQQLTAHRQAVLDASGTAVRGNVSHTVETRVVANSSGLRTLETRQLAQSWVKIGPFGFAVTHGPDIASLDPRALVTEANSRVDLPATTDDVRLPVVLDRLVVAQVLDRLSPCFTSVERALGNGRFLTTKQLAAPHVTLLDDARIPGAPATTAFDDEGLPATTTTLVADGELQAVLSSWTGDPATSTASGRRRDPLRPPRSAVSTVVLTSAHVTNSRDLGRFVLIDRIDGLHRGWNPVTSRIQARVSGRCGEEGFQDVPLATTLPELLSSAVAVLDDCAMFPLGHCLAAPSLVLSENFWQVSRG
jgi:predicted Zn-dependent protease